MIGQRNRIVNLYIIASTIKLSPVLDKIFLKIAEIIGGWVNATILPKFTNTNKEYWDNLLEKYNDNSTFSRLMKIRILSSKLNNKAITDKSIIFNCPLYYFLDTEYFDFNSDDYQKALNAGWPAHIPITLIQFTPEEHQKEENTALWDDENKEIIILVSFGDITTAEDLEAIIWESQESLKHEIQHLMQNLYRDITGAAFGGPSKKMNYHYGDGDYYADFYEFQPNLTNAFGEFKEFKNIINSRNWPLLFEIFTANKPEQVIDDYEIFHNDFFEYLRKNDLNAWRSAVSKLYKMSF